MTWVIVVRLNLIDIVTFYEFINCTTMIIMCIQCICISQDLLNIAKQYGLTVSLASTPIPMKTEVEDGSIFPGDPVLSSLPIAHLNPGIVSLYG